MAIAVKLLIILLGMVLVAAGIRSIVRKEAKLSWDEDSDGHRIVEGFPAVLIGILEVAIGLFIIVFQRHPWST